MWKPRAGSTAKAGSVTVNGLRQRYAVFVNDRKKPGSNEPDFVLLSADEPEADPYSRQGRAAQRPAPAPATTSTEAEDAGSGFLPDEDVPF